MSQHIRIGRLGEDLAANALCAQGYRVVERNWRCREGEIDLVTRDAEAWVFVEVKTRRGRHVEWAEESLKPDKIARLTLLAQTYLADRMLGNVDWRIDFVSVVLDRDNSLDSLCVTKALTVD